MSADGSVAQVSASLAKTSVSRNPTGAAKAGKKKAAKAASGGAAAGPDELADAPEYFAHRVAIFEKFKQEHVDFVAAQARETITITLDNGDTKEGQSWVTSPADIARAISKTLFERTVIAEVDGDLWDLERPLEKSCKLKLLDFDHPEGRKVFWHSSAHILGEAAERRFGCDLCIGPPFEEGFYYEMALPEGGVVQSTDYAPLERVATKAIKEKQPFERLVLSKEQLLEMFKTNKYKVHIINDKIPDGTSTTVYRCGPLIDLCRGPHIPHTGRVKAFKIMKNSASYFLGDANNDSLQRIYGVSFPEKKLMDEHLKYLEEAAKRDHRKISKDQELFFFHEYSPGSCFFLPHGMIIYNTLMAFIREQYWKRDYQEVFSPNMYNVELWKRSGHWAHYQEDMFRLDVEKDTWALKPMNCPGHCLMFAHRERSYRELPMRVADFGILHRNEASGALSGLTRVRRFVQDDSHIFCAEEQVEAEVFGIFDFLQEVYGQFGFQFKLKLSTRPDERLGTDAMWDRAEGQLESAIRKFSAETGVTWEINPGDGAFYGPKIDITISDALRREHQCATVQLDFNLPIRFNLTYQTSDNQRKAESKPVEAKPACQSSQPAPVDGSEAEKACCNHGDDEAAKAEANKFVEVPVPAGYARPVMLHRAIYGSFERFIAIITEHFAGKWPFWLSPRQILIVPVMPAVNDYVYELHKTFRGHRMHVDVDVSGNTLQKKIRTGQLSGYNYIFVVGAEEKEKRMVNIRSRDDPESQKRGELIPLDDAVKRLVALRDSRSLEYKL